jgi:hypothetical protein
MNVTLDIIQYVVNLTTLSLSLIHLMVAKNVGIQ